MSATAGRRYRGMDAEARAAERRRRLLDAGLELFGTRGYAATPIEAVCAAAGVTSRHLYEAFRSREGLLLAVYEEVLAQHTAKVGAALAGTPAPLEAHLRAGVECAVAAWLDDERRARVAFIEVVGVSPAVEARRTAAIGDYARLLAADLSGRDDVVTGADLEVGALAVVGGITTLLTSRLQTGAPAVAAIVEETVRLLVAATAPR